MSGMLDAVASLSSFLLVVAAFGLLPNLVLNILVRCYPTAHPRRQELLAEIWVVPRIQRPLWVAEQIGTVAFEAIPLRLRRAYVDLLVVAVVLATGGAMRIWLILMPRSQRTVLVLRVAVGVNRMMVATMTNTSEPVVMQLQHHALDRLRFRIRSSERSVLPRSLVGWPDVAIGRTRPSRAVNSLRVIAVRRLREYCT